MPRTKHTGLFLYTIPLLLSALMLLRSTSVRAQDATRPGIPEDAVPKVIDQPKEKDSTPEAGVMAPPRMAPSRTPPAFDPKKYDWIRLTSGEWLKGDVLSMRDDKFEFDSDEMEEQSFDWEDIAELRSSRKYTYGFTGRRSLVGTALILDNEVVISVDGEERVLKRADLLSIVPAGTRKRERWDGKLSVGLAFRQGNTNQTDFTYQAYVRRRDAFTRARFDFNGAFGKVEEIETVNNHGSTFKFDLFLSPRFYVTPFSVIFYHDKFQNIDFQVTPAAGGGYHALKKKKAELDLELAGGYQYTRYISVEAGADQENRSGAVIPRIRLETDPLKDVDLDALYQTAITVPDPEDTTMHGELILSVEITKIFDLDVSWIWDRVQNPQPDEDGTIPEKDDVKLTVGIGIDF